MKNTLLSLVALTATLASPAFSQHIDGYTSLGIYNIRGTYVQSVSNPATNKIYVNSESYPDYTTTIGVISGTTHKITTSIAATVNAGVRVLSVNSVTNTIYSLNVDGTVTVIDGSIDQVIATIPSLTTDNCLYNIVVDDSANKLVLIDPCNTTAYVLDGSSYALLATVNTMLYYGVAAAVNPVTHLLYITGGNDHAYTVVDLTAYTATEVSLNIAYPTGAAVDTTYNRIFIGDEVFEKLYVVDGATNNLLSTVSLPYTSDGLYVDQKTHILAVDGYGLGVDFTLFFYHDFNMSADGQVSFGSKESYYPSGNPNNNMFYIGISPSNTLAFIQGPTH